MPLRLIHKSSALLLCCVLPVCAQQTTAPPPVITLEEALRLAAEHNAHLPVAALNAAIAQAQLREARARLKPRLFLDGDVHEGAPPTYSAGDTRLQAIGVDTLFDGGRLRAGVRISEFQVRSAVASYRVAQKEVELDLRTWFATGVRFQREIAIRRAGLERLRNYLALIEALRASGQGLAGDVLRTRSRLALEEANVVDAERQLDEAQVEVNNLMGRHPRSAFIFAELPAPQRPPAAAGTPWLRTPDISQATALTEAARAAITIARADRRPQLSVTADVGVLPTLPTLGNASGGGSGLNTGRGAGAEITLWFTWPVFDAGIYRSRLEQAQLAARQAADSAFVVRRQSELEWSRAVEQLEDLFRAVDLRTRNVPLSRDAYLEVESLYRGGVGTALDVLDAYVTWVDAQVAQADAELNYRQAEARLLRWGSP